MTSEVFERALRNWHRFDEARGTSGAWLFGIARNVVADCWRRRGGELSVAVDPREALAAPDPEPDRAVIDAKSRRELHIHLERLTDKERDAVALRFGAGLRATEVAAALGVSDTAARMLVYRAVSKLREVIVDA